MKYVSASPIALGTSVNGSPTLKKGGPMNTSTKYLPNATVGMEIKLEPLMGTFDNQGQIGKPVRVKSRNPTNDLLSLSSAKQL